MSARPASLLPHPATRRAKASDARVVMRTSVAHRWRAVSSDVSSPTRRRFDFLRPRQIPFAGRVPVVLAAGVGDLHVLSTGERDGGLEPARDAERAEVARKEAALEPDVARLSVGFAAHGALLQIGGIGEADALHDEAGGADLEQHLVERGQVVRGDGRAELT